MRWSFLLARIFGIEVRVHATLGLALIYFALGLAWPPGARGLVYAAVLLLSSIACLALHELGHCLAAVRLGMDVNEVVLLPIGGTARLSGEPRKPIDELFVALAGPAVNLAIALGLGLVLWRYQVAFELSDWQRSSDPSTLGLVRALFWVNAGFALFNLLPALPLDGGRVLRALLSSALGRTRATRIAALGGTATALCLLGIALKKDSGSLALIAACVFAGATQERAFARATELLSELRAGEVCDPNAVVFGPHEQLGYVLDTLVRSSQAHFAVFRGKQLVGTLGREHVLAHLPRIGLETPLASLMQREVYAVDAGTPLHEVRRQLLELAGRPVVVRSPAGYAGVLGFEDLHRITVIAERLARAGIRRPQPVPNPALH